VELWASYWAASVRKVLEACDDKPIVSPEDKKQVLASPPFVLSRFPAMINALVDGVQHALVPQQNGLAQVMCELCDRYYGRMSQWSRSRPILRALSRCVPAWR
jgi:hypothetical protein